jgi:predicted dehydrogenase
MMKTSRRFFFLGTLLAGAVPQAGFGSTGSLKRLGFRSPNERLNIAAIGAGGRAATNIGGCAGENIVAFADPDDARAAETYGKYGKVPRYQDFRRMLDQQSDIDAVIVSTPDHVHAVAAYWAMERGKHVYVEKPLARTVWECRFLAAAAAKYKVATQMGNQGYSYDGERIASEIIWSGEIGNVTEMHAWTDRPVWPQGIEQLPAEEQVPKTLNWDAWLGPAAMRPYASAYLPFNWRAWFDFGSGAIGDGACHSMGAGNMALLLSTIAPSSVEAVRQEGKNRYTFPKKSMIRWDFPARGALCPVTVFWYDGVKHYPYRPPGLAETEWVCGGPGSFGAGGGLPGMPPRSASAATSRSAGGIPPFAQGGGTVFVGDKGFLTGDGYGANIRLLPESRHNAYKLPAQVLPRSPGHYADWIRACKGLQPEPCSNFSVAAPFSEWALLGAIALRFEGKLDWDAARMRFTNNAEANNYLKPKWRKGWELPEISKFG